MKALIDIIREAMATAPADIAEELAAVIREMEQREEEVNVV